MWLGPVFQAELVSSSRRARAYLGRFLYGLLVLLIVGMTYQSAVRNFAADREISIAWSARFGQAIFSSFATLQSMIVLTMTPAMVAGAIADERQRKTLHYLMASRLSSAEIILGKVAARLLRVAVLGAIGLPVLNLVALFGGVDFGAVLLVYAATATTTFFLAALSILCSVGAAKPREAIMRAYFCEILWIALAPIVLSTMSLWSPFWQGVGVYIQPPLEWLAASAPSGLLRGNLMMGSINRLVDSAWWMMGLQAAGGSLLLAVAAWRLRPAFRGMDGPTLWARLFRRGTGRRGRIRLWARPAVGDDAMLWKEMHLHRVSDARKVFLGLLGAAIVGLIGYSGWQTAFGAFEEVWAIGYWANGPNQRDIHDSLQVLNFTAIVVVLVGLGTMAASSISSEREADTWTNLASSPIDGWDLIRGKVVGALWLFRPVGYFLVGCWACGVLIGAVHPFGMLVCLVEGAVFAYFIAILGVSLSLTAKNTTQAMTGTIGALFLLNIGYLIVFTLFQVRTMVILAGCMPFLFSSGLLGTDGPQQPMIGTTSEIFVAGLCGTLGYGLGAFGLTLRAVRNYDRVVDRPDRFRGTLSPAALAKAKGGHLPTAEL